MEHSQTSLKTKLSWAAAALLAALVLAILVDGYVQGRWTWEGTGFSGASFWDWLDLLIVPVILGIGGISLQRTQRQREQEADRRRRERELEVEERQRKRGQEIEEQRAQSVALQAYLKQMARLILEAGLHKVNEGSIDDVIANWPDRTAKESVARAYTLTTLEQMDSIRKRSIVRFLFEARLCTTSGGGVVSLKEADLTQADLRGMYLPGIDLTGTNLRQANLSDARLVRLEPNVSSGGVVWTPRPGEDYFPHLEPREVSAIDDADLREANLRNARLQYCSLFKTKLKLADVRGADLRKAKGIGQEQIEEAIGDQETLLPEYCRTPEAWSLSFEEQLRRLKESKG